MKNNEPIDLSPIAADPAQLRAMTERTLDRVEMTLARRRSDPLRTLAGWSRPVGIAAALLFGLLLPIEWVLEQREPHAEEIQELVRLSTSTVLGGSEPSGAQLVEAIGRGALP